MRLQRIGRKHQPSYRLVVAERRSKLGAPPTEDLGSYDPFAKKLAAKNERVSYWVSKGAQPTVTVHNLLIKGGIIEGKKIPVGQRKPKKGEAPAETAFPAAQAEAAPKAAEAPEETPAEPAI